jgi:universal bacterial protein YeaZ
MKVLAIDTATEACSAALLAHGSVLERYSLAPRRHADLILPMIESLLAEAELSVTALDALAFGRGPGSFTGVRIAAGVIQGMAYGADLPVLGVSNLAALAQGLYTEMGAAQVLAALDARMSEVYWGAYCLNPDDFMVLQGEETVCQPEHVPRIAGSGWVGCGSGWDRYGKDLKDYLSAAVTGWVAERYSRAKDVALLGEYGYTRGLAITAEQALPVYLRDRVTTDHLRFSSVRY